jgi:hypothetical protein
MPNGSNNGNRWETYRHSQLELRKKFKRPVPTKELREHFGGPENLKTFRKNNDIEVLDEVLQLNYMRGWLQALPIGERTPYDYILAGRILFQSLELKAATAKSTRSGMENILKVLRQAATHYTDLADELERHLEQTEDVGTDGSLHSSEGD